MPVDATIYPGTASNTGTSSDPAAEIIKTIQLRNAMGNLNKVKGGMPGTQDALDSCGAGLPYNPSYQSQNP